MDRGMVCGRQEGARGLGTLASGEEVRRDWANQLSKRGEGRVAMDGQVRVLAPVFAFVLALLLCGCGSEANKSTDLAIGEPAVYGGLRVTVVEVAQFGVVDRQTANTVKYENNTGGAVRADQSDWELEDTRGGRSQDMTVGLGEEALPSGEVAAGATVEGRVFFDMATKNLSRVVYKPPKDLGDVNEATWVAGYARDQ